MPMSTSEVQTLLMGLRSDALSAESSSKLSDERTKAMDYYLGDISSDIPDPVDRSKVVSSDVAEAVEGLMPGLMEVFCSGDEVVKFNPVGEEDESAAEQETDYVNHVFMQKNPGFMILYTFIKDALLQKNGIVKIWWEERNDEERETYRGLDDNGLAMLMVDPEVEIVEHTEHAA